MNSSDIRKKFQHYFTHQGHTWVPSSSLIPQGDSSLLFTNAGMNQFKDGFLGLKPPPSTQVCSIQKCLRAGGKHNDLEEVGYSPYHHTFFEMIGSFSFGSYFKKQAIEYAINFLTKELGLPKDRLWVSVFKEDKESAEIWQKQEKVSLEKIFFLDEKDNFWRMGDTGPCGPCSEIYYYDGPKKNPLPEDMTEIWNLVFMEFNEDRSGRKAPLPKPCVDTGMGLERLAAVLQGEKSNYHTDLFKGIIKCLEKASDVKYDFTQTHLNEEQVAFRVIADHSRAIAFLICDGVLPGSDGASYVLRRILRRALFYSQKLTKNKNLLSIAVKQVTHLMENIYPELSEENTLIDSTIKAESELFTESLEMGKNILLQKIKNLSGKTIPDSIVWNLYSTYGFPPDLTRLIAKEKGFEVNENFNLEKFKQTYISSFRKQSIKRNLEESIQQLNSREYKSNPITKTEFTGYNKDQENSQITHLLFIEKPLDDPIMDENIISFAAQRPRPSSSIKKEKDGKLKITLWTRIDDQAVSYEKTIEQNENELYLITDKTCFYPEGGGPVGDKGIIKTETGQAEVLDCQKKGNFIFHAVKILEGEIKTNQACEMHVDPDHRRLIATSHSATHLLHQALREILGKSVRQKGSLVEPGKLRFDFSHSKPLSKEQLKTIENKVIEYIQKSHSVSDATYPYREAIHKGALSLAGETYENEVRVIQMGESLEFCGGIHVKNTSDIGSFKIISETGVQSGVRRITAYTSDIAKKWFSLLETQNNTLRKYLNIPLPNTPERENPFIHYFQKKEEEIKTLKTQIKISLNRTNSEKKALTTEKTTFEHTQSKEPYFLVHQNEELREYLKLPLPKNFEETDAIFVPFFQKQEEQIKTLKKQLENITSSFNLDNLIKKAKPFEHQNIKGYLLSIALPIEDRKILAETADQLKSKRAPAIVVILGEGEKQFPLVITVSKELQQYISAGELLKNTIAPFLNGKGGGQARFAQGTIKNKSRFAELENILLKALPKNN
ncbi:MAG: alanine--tRNA ligase [Bdellovibrionales bacterium]|nr:alanine--tRNA ligase [Bdellovibrionales bacterium]